MRDRGIDQRAPCVRTALPRSRRICRTNIVAAVECVHPPAAILSAMRATYFVAARTPNGIRQLYGRIIFRVLTPARVVASFYVVKTS